MDTEIPIESQAPAAAAPPKFSRYRSVRKAAAATSKTTPPPIPEPNPEIKRSMSRYKKGPLSNAQATSPPKSTPLPTIPAKYGANEQDKGAYAGRGVGEIPARYGRNGPDPKRSQTDPYNQPDSMAPRKDRGGHRSNSESAGAQVRLENDAQREAFAILNGETNRQKKLRHEQHERERVNRKVREDEELARLKAIEDEEREQREEEERLRQEAHKREQAKIAAKEAEKARRQAEKEQKRQASLKQASIKQASLQQSSMKSPRRPRTTSHSHDDYRDDSSPDEGHGDTRGTPNSKRKVPFLSRPGNGPPLPKTVNDKPPQISLGFDAPISAVNAGTRKVLVKYNDLSTKVEVTPESTSDDILRAAAVDLKESSIPTNCIVAESFKQVGLERPLRRYERIRDIMNSWDHDEQNIFLILPAQMAEGAAVNVKDAPSDPPEEISVNVHYSNKPGSWDKRWITLRSDGQVLVSKHPGEDQKNICHMTDFDIYMPTTKRLKRIKPPKKYCFAMKSQQKSAMFLSAANFVHFVSTKDRDQASTWYSAVQSWRSWYLIHEMGLGKNQPESHSSVPHRPTHQRSTSAESTLAYQIGSFKPFLSDDIFGNLLVDSATSRPTAQASQPFNSRGGPPVSFPRKLTKDPQPTTIITSQPSEPTPDPFSTTGLLGRSYSKRQAALQDRDITHRQPGDHLLPGQKPLLDFTPAHKEPIQYSSKGRGFVPTQVPSGGLVNMATGRQDEPFTSPPSFSPPAPPQPAVQAPGVLRSGTVHSSRTSRPRPTKPDCPEDSAFTGGGLLAAADDGVGAGRVGRGVKSGHRGQTEPLLDMREDGQYLKGSLLDSVEKWEDSEGLGRKKSVVDRSRRREGDVRTGERV